MVTPDRWDEVEFASFPPKVPNASSELPCSGSDGANFLTGDEGLDASIVLITALKWRALGLKADEIAHMMGATEDLVEAIAADNLCSVGKCI